MNGKDARNSDTLNEKDMPLVNNCCLITIQMDVGRVALGEADPAQPLDTFGRRHLGDPRRLRTRVGHDFPI